MILLKIATMMCLAFICGQDLLYRAVYWICFPILAVLLFVMKYNLLGVAETLKDAGYGLLFLLVQLLILSLYFSVKNKRLTNITQDYLGWGDVLFLIAIVFFLSPVNYVLFYIISLVLVLLYVMVSTLLSAHNNKHIPLAGLQAALLGIIMTFDFFTPGITLYNDGWIYF